MTKPEKLDLVMDRICSNCGLTYGSHRGSSRCYNQCPEHQGRMDWSKETITAFEDSGCLAKIPYGTPRKQLIGKEP